MSDDTTPIYYRVSPALWRDRSWTDDMRLLACYLLTSPHRTLEGLFVLPKGYICGDLQWSPERLTEPFARLLADGFIAYDEPTEVCLIVKAMKYQRPENPNMDKSAIRRLVTIAETSLDQQFFASAKRFAERFAKRLGEQLPQRFGKPQLYSSSTLLNPALIAGEVPKPVDNSAEPERGCSIEHEEHEPEPPADTNGDGAAASHAATGDNVGTLRHSPTCEDRECAVRTLRCGLRGTIAQIVGPAEAGNLYNESTALHKSLAGMAGYICAATWKASAAATMEQRHPLCRKALVAYVDQLYEFHRQKPIRSLPAFLKTRYGNMTEAPVSDELLAELRKLERHDTSRKGEPQRVGTTLAPEFAGPMVKTETEEAS